jgi:tRNA(Arg) A34 adenosine deaminase TadA
MMLAVTAKSKSFVLGTGIAIGSVAVLAAWSWYHSNRLMWARRGGRRSGISRRDFLTNDNSHSDEKQLVILLHHFLDVVERDILPVIVTGVYSPGESDLRGVALLRDGDYSVINSSMNQDDNGPLLHAELVALYDYFTLQKSCRSPPENITVLATHEPCSLCVACLVRSKFSKIYFLFRRPSEESDECAQCGSSGQNHTATNKPSMLCIDEILRTLLSKRMPQQQVGSLTACTAKEQAEAAALDRLLMHGVQRVKTLQKVFNRLDDEKRISKLQA